MIRKVVLWSAWADSPVNFVIWLVLIFKVFEPSPSSITCNDFIICIIHCLIFAVLSEVLTLLQIIARVRVCFYGSGFLFVKRVKYRSLISPLCTVMAPCLHGPLKEKVLTGFLLVTGEKYDALGYSFYLLEFIFSPSFF